MKDGVSRNKREKVDKMNEIVKKYSIYLEHGIYLTDSVDCCQQQLATQINDNCVSALCFAIGFVCCMYMYKLNGLVGVPFSCRFLHWRIWIFQSRICYLQRQSLQHFSVCVRVHSPHFIHSTLFVYIIQISSSARVQHTKPKFRSA